MPVSFDNIPATLRTPGVFVEFSNELAAANTPTFKILVIGQRLPSGSAGDPVPRLVSRKSDAELLFGRGSMLAEMIKAALDASLDIEIWGSALNDPVGTNSVGTLTFTGAATAAGTVIVYIGGKRLAIAVANGATAATVATNVSAAVNADTSLPVTSSATAGVVTLTSRHTTEVANSIGLSMNYYPGEVLPSGISASIVGIGGGTGTVDFTSVIAALGEQWWNWIVCPYTDTFVLPLLEAELNDRWGPLEQKGARAFTAYGGTFSATTAFGVTRNSPHVSCMATGLSPTPPYIWAAVNAAIAARSLSIDPARPLQRLALPGVLPAKREERWIQSERNTALFDGISTHTVDVDGTVRIERQITMYQKNSGNIADASYLDINTPETLERIRFDQRARISQRFPRHKLAADGTQYGAGQAIVTPSTIRAELLGLYREMEAKGWVEDFAGYKDSLIVEIDATDRNRVNVLDQPNLVNQFRIHAQRTNFIV